MTEPEPVVLVDISDHVMTITLNRPESLNAVNAQLARSVAQALMDADANPDVRAVILTGAGDRMFSAGADLKAMAAGENVVPVDAPHSAYGFGGSTERTTMKPLIGACNGSAYGGGVEMLLQCDMVVAERGGRFALPEVQVGIFAAAGGAYRLAQLLPRPVALDVLLTGAPITTERAYELGLVSRITEPGGALAEARAVAARIVANAPLAVQSTKRIARDLVDGVHAPEVAAQRRSDEEFRRILASEDAAEGPRAFAEKREPVWSGR